MALVDLKSDLSWYSAKGEPRGYRPNPDKQSTDFVYNDDLTLSARPKGFDNAGFAAMFPAKTTADEFQIDNTTTSFRGTARRMNQLGEGTRFPIGPLGQVHKFDLPRLGFNPVTKYEEVYGPLSNSGLADTYTLKSPIDDMYNKFKVRDEAFNRGNIREPFILRGIQRDDNSDPQRFVGSNSPVDIPRGGLLTATERSAIDVARISKFLATTKGLNFITKQSTLALMNPNIEGADGEAQGKEDRAQSVHINSAKLFTPANTLAQIGSAFTGLHVRKLGLSPVNIQDTILNSPPMEYEKIITTTRAEQGDLTNDNRLVLIYRDLIRDTAGDYVPETISKGTAIPQLTAPLGPTALSFDGGIGDTTIRRWSVTIPSNQQEIPTGDQSGKAGSIKFEEYQKDRYGYSDDDSKGYIAKLQNDGSPLEQFIIDNRRDFKLRMVSIINPLFTGEDAENQFRNTNYDDITKGNELRKEAGPSYSKLVDFRSYTNADGQEIHEAFASYAKDEDTSNKAGRSGRSEFLLSRLREDAKEGNRFNGVGDSFRAQADNIPSDIDNIPNTFNPNDPVTGKPIASIAIPTEDEYTAIGKLAGDRNASKAQSADTDFRYNGNEKYQPYKIGPADEIGIARQTDDTNTDGINNLNKSTPQRNPAKSAGEVASAPELYKYKALAYDSIQAAAEERKASTKILYGRDGSWPARPSTTGAPGSFKDGIFWKDTLQAINGKLQQYNQKMEDGELIIFKFNSIVFEAYIDQISDSFSPGYTSEPDQNRADPRYLYTSFERKIQLSFKVVYRESDRSPWSKLKALADLSLPNYSTGPWAQRVDVTIGSLYKGVPMLIESVSYDWDNETPWSLAGDQADNHDGLPMYTQVQLGLIYMGNVKAAAGEGYVAYA
jgi:hypothetical protein